MTNETIINQLQTKQTRMEIYTYIKDKSDSNPNLFQDGRLHNYFIEDLISLDEVKEALNKARAEGNREAVCQTCGFPTDIQRMDVFLKNNVVDLLQAERNQCPECGHQQDGWNIKPVYEHMQAVHNNFMAKKREQVRMLKVFISEWHPGLSTHMNKNIDKIFSDCIDLAQRKERDNI